jgi:hypothetical protein
MSMDTILSIVSNLGFPIACVIGLGWYVKYISDKHSNEMTSIMDKHEKEIDKLRDSHEKQTKELKESFDKNTGVLTELVIWLKSSFKGGNEK